MLVFTPPLPLRSQVHALLGLHYLIWVLKLGPAHYISQLQKATWRGFAIWVLCRSCFEVVYVYTSYKNICALLYQVESGQRWRRIIQCIQGTPCDRALENNGVCALLRYKRRMKYAENNIYLDMVNNSFRFSYCCKTVQLFVPARCTHLVEVGLVSYFCGRCLIGLGASLSRKP